MVDKSTCSPAGACAATAAIFVYFGCCSKLVRVIGCMKKDGGVSKIKDEMIEEEDEEVDSCALANRICKAGVEILFP